MFLFPILRRPVFEYVGRFWGNTDGNNDKDRGESEAEDTLRLHGGEGGIRTPGTGFSQYNGLANLPALLIRSENFGLYYIPQQLTTNRC